jgi:hypothetical protein
VRRWASLVAGDIGVFTRKGAAFATARLITKAHHAALARALWGHDKHGMTWEYLLFFDTVRRLTPGVPYRDLARALGYDPNWKVLGASYLEAMAARAALALLGQADPEYSRRKKES